MWELREIKDPPSLSTTSVEARTLLREILDYEQKIVPCYWKCFEYLLMYLLIVF
jgi:hypothetical protein